MSVWMSWIEFSLTTTTRGILEATLPCIFTKLYQRPIDHRLNQFGAVPVVQGDELVGILSVSDFLDHVIAQEESD